MRTSLFQRSSGSITLQAVNGSDALHVTIQADGDAHHALVEQRGHVQFAHYAQAYHLRGTFLQVLPQRMQRPAGAVAVLSLDAQRGVVVDQHAQQIALAFLQVLEGANADQPQPLLACLPLDAPDILLHAPQLIEPRLGAAFLYLVALVIDAQPEIPFTEPEGLHLAVLAVLVVLGQAGDKVVLIEVNDGQVIVESEIHPRESFRQIGAQANRSSPCKKPFMQTLRALMPQGNAAEGDKE